MERHCQSTSLSLQRTQSTCDLQNNSIYGDGHCITIQLVLQRKNRNIKDTAAMYSCTLTGTLICHTSSLDTMVFMHRLSSVPLPNGEFHLLVNDCKTSRLYLHTGKQFHRPSVSYRARFTSKLAASISLASMRSERFIDSSAIWSWLESVEADKPSAGAPSIPSWNSH